MGLLGDGFDDPKTQFNLALASGLLSSRGGLGQALGQSVPMAMQARQQGMNAIAQRDNQALQQQLTKAQIEETLAQAEQRKRAPKERKYMVVGNNIFDPETGTFMQGPTVPKEPKPINNDFLELLQAAGIDPASEEGKGLLKAQINRRNAPPSALLAQADKKQMADAMRQERMEHGLAKADSVISEAEGALKNVSPLTTGAAGAVIGQIPGTSAYNLRSTVKTIQANLGFDELQAMREASKTGGALGSIAVKELELLTSAKANLDPNQSDEQLRANLKKVITHYRNWANALKRAQAGNAKVVPGGPRSSFGDEQPIEAGAFADQSMEAEFQEWKRKQK